MYYNGFEESTTGTTSTSKFGLKGWNGVFTISGNLLPSGTYRMNWWELFSGTWIYKTQDITINGVNNIEVGNGGIIDEVLIRPTSSAASTFNHDPSVGLIGKSTDNGSGLKFDFDNIGRLITIKDDKDNILKSFIYKYYGGQ